MKALLRNRRGQILVLVTLVLITMCGLLGLAVDLGWSYFMEKSAQAAADAAALAAVESALATLGPVGPYACSDLTCSPTPTPCLKPNPKVTNIDVGCVYAEQNGFSVGGNAGRQNVLMQADVTSPPPTAPGVVTQYWVTARVAETIPQLFSSVLGNFWGVTSARATAAVTKSAVNGSLILLNRQNDCIPLESGNKVQCGVDLLVQANDNQGQYALQADGGVLMASLSNGVNNPDGRYAGENQGGGTVYAPYTYIRGAGWYTLGGSSSWIQTPINQKPDSHWFKDPMRGLYQPPPPPAERVTEPAAYPEGVLGGVISGSADPADPLVLKPGAYYATVKERDGRVIPTGLPIRITGAVHFSSGDLPFAEYVFFGGVSAGQQGQGATEFTFDPGRYVFAGAKPKQNGEPNPSFDITSNIVMTDGSQPFTANTNAGEIFIFTDTNYVGWDWVTKAPVPLTLPERVKSIAGMLKFGTSGFQAGANVDVRLNLHGINTEHANLPEDLKPFDAPILLWQDQNNSVVKYYDDPSDPTSFNLPCVVDDDWCENTRLASNKSPELFFKASPGSSLYGVIYQPRGAWTTVIGGSGYAGPLQIVSGGFRLQGNAVLRLQGLNDPIMRNIAALVE